MTKIFLPHHSILHTWTQCAIGQRCILSVLRYAFCDGGGGGVGGDGVGGGGGGGGSGGGSSGGSGGGRDCGILSPRMILSS